MFPVIVNDGTAEIPDDDICYIVGKEGIFLKKKLGVMDSIAPVKNISILESVQTMARMHIRKIPAKKAQQVINFFKEVYKVHYGEAIVLLFYNLETKQHKIVVPVQEVSGGAADYNKGITIDGWDMIGTIHSHASMSAFHSGVDDNDEKSFDGLHITFGNMRDDDISVSASIVANGHRVIVNPCEYINQMELTVDINEEEKIPAATTWRWDSTKHKMVQVKTGKYYTRRKFDQRYRVRLAKDPKFPAEWMERVSKKTYTNIYSYGSGWDQGWYGYNAHNPHYDKNAWKGWQGHGVKNTKTGKPKTMTPPPSVVVGSSGALIPAKPIPPTVKPKTTPCDDCTFKNHKVNMMIEHMDDQTKKSILAWAIEQLEGENYKVVADDPVDDTGLTHYHCMGCNNYLSFDEDADDVMACCPTCQSEDYLVEVTAAEIMMEAEGSDNEELEPGMIKCSACASSFTKDFLNDGKCPTCGNQVMDPHAVVEYKSEVTDSGYIACPDCGHQNMVANLELDNRCNFCPYEFEPFEIRNAMAESLAAARLNSAESIEDPMEEQLKKDSGMYLDSDQEAINRIAEQDQERIPVPGSDSTPINKKSGVFASLFEKAKKAAKGL